MKKLWWSCLAVLAACDETAAPAWDKTEISATTRAFSSTVNGGLPGSGSGYGDRRGPQLLWADSVSALNAPAKSGAKSQTLAMGMSQGPEVLVGSLAVSIDATVSTTVATDLDSKAEKWRLTMAQSFLPGFVLTDGTALCGLATLPPNNFNSANLQCVVLATGASMWTKNVPRWLNQSQGQGYGLAAQFAIRGSTLFVIGGGQVNAYALADGTELWNQPATALFRSLVFVGDDLVVENATANCAAGTNCVRALNPATGATVAEYTAAASFLWASGGNAFFLSLTGGERRTAIKFDSATHAFTEDATMGATFAGTAPLDLFRPGLLGGASELLPSGKVLLISSTLMQGTGPPVLCRYAIATKKMDWCQQLPFGPTQLRAHPNVIFLAQNAQTASLPAEPTSSSGVTDLRFYFGHWAFTLGDVYAYR